MNEVNLDAMNLTHQRKGDLLWYDGKEWTRVAKPTSATDGRQALLWDFTAEKPAWGSPEESGTIKVWNGSIVSIPTGWQLCDGTNGTPDFRNFFIVGAGSTYSVDATGGATTAGPLTHTGAAVSAHAGAGVSAHAGAAVANHGNHTHTTTGLTVQSGTGADPANHADTGNPISALTHSVTQPDNHTVTQPSAHTVTQPDQHNAFSILPPYLAKAWIMKL